MSSSTHIQASNKKSTQQQQQQNGVTVLNSTNSTPASTPNTNGTMAPQQQEPTPSQSTSPPANNAPKYGTLVPNRVFVGGISANTTEVELAQLFSAYGNVKATKIISDRAGVSKGYGFVTFESEEEAKRLQRESENIMLRERRLNIAPAIKKQPFNRSFDMPSPPPNAAAQAQFYYATAAASGVPYAYQNGMAYYTPPQTTCANADPTSQPAVYQAPPVYAATPTAAPPAAPFAMPLYPPQPLYVHHNQFPYQPIYTDPSQYYGARAPSQYMYRSTQQPTSTLGSNSNVSCNTTCPPSNGGSNSSSATASNTMVPVTGYPASNHSSTFTNHGQPLSTHTLPHAPAPPASSVNHRLCNSPRSYTQPPNTYCHTVPYPTPDCNMFYNMPMYPMEGPSGSYSESLGRATPVPPMSETAHSTVDQQQLQTMPSPMMGHAMHHPAISPRPPSANLIPVHSTGAIPKMLNRQLPVQPAHNTQHNVPYMHNARNGYNCPPQPPAHTPQPQVPPIPPQVQPMAQPAANDNQSTPVVSLLSLGQGNERDLRSMQGGRKCRQDKSPIEVNTNGFPQYRITGVPMYSLNTLNGNQPSTAIKPPPRSWSNRQRYFNHPDLKLLTNSNASTNYDENVNERKHRGPGDYRGTPDFMALSKNTSNSYQSEMSEPIPVLADSRSGMRPPTRITPVPSSAILGSGRRKKRNYARRTTTVVRCISPVENQDTDGSYESGSGSCNNLVATVNNLKL